MKQIIVFLKVSNATINNLTVINLLSA